MKIARSIQNICIGERVYDIQACEAEVYLGAALRASVTFIDIIAWIEDYNVAVYFRTS